MTLMHHIKPGDIMLRWVSELETGTWAQFRQAAATCLAASDELANASTLARRMSSLGHLDIDWEAGRWSVAPPVVVVARGMGMCAYLAGWRTGWLESRFERATDNLNIFPLEQPQNGAPVAKYAKCGNIEAIEELARDLYVGVVWDPSAQLADMVSLPRVSDLPFAATPFGEDEVEMLDPQTGRFSKVTTTTAEGLYTYEVNGRPAYRLHIDDDWRVVDRATGMLQVLQGSPLMCWHKASADLTSARAVAVPVWLALPPVAERSLVSATGLLPIRQGERRVFRNVSRDVAQRISDALGIVLDIADQPLPIAHQGAA
ncbi:MAG: hypothetical protein OXG34_01235 [bacterium]|nr:hypothetical protein [bacterium]